MTQEIRMALENIKSQMLEITEHLTIEEQEEFFSEINDWTYDRYEMTLTAQEPEVQDYEND